MNTAIIEAALELHYGVSAHSVGRQQFESTIAELAVSAGLSVENWLERATVDSLLLQQLIQQLPIGESWLQRDPEQFRQIRNWLQQRDTNTPLHVLCAPCASGEEAWSLAALLFECGWRAPLASIHAVDINPQSLMLAQASCYRRSAWREAAELPWWLHASGEGSAARVQVSPMLTPLVQFECANLLNFNPKLSPAGYDLLLSRNFLLYLGAAARQRWLDQLLALGAPDARWFSARCEPLALWDERLVELEQGGYARAHTHGTGGEFKASATAFGQVQTHQSVSLAVVGPDLSGRSCCSCDQPSQSKTSPTAIGHVQIEQDVRPDAMAQMHAALRALQLDQLEQAEELLRGVLFLDRDHEEALLHLAALCERRGASDEAQRLRARVLRQAALPT